MPLSRIVFPFFLIVILGAYLVHACALCSLGRRARLFLTFAVMNRQNVGVIKFYGFELSREFKRWVQFVKESQII